MPQLNYHHLRLFHVVAEKGGIARAAESLNLTPQTISSQLRSFEGVIGEELFERQGKKLLLNEKGRKVQEYSRAIFGLGEELQQFLVSHTEAEQAVFSVGVLDVIPKVLVFDLVEPCLRAEPGLRLAYREGELDFLLRQLALGKLDVVLSDRPLTPGGGVRAYNHLLGEVGISFFAAKDSVRRLARNFPESLHNEPFLIHGEKSLLRVHLLSWFEEMGIGPRLAAEFDDSAAIKYFGQAGFGAFCAPSNIERNVLEQYEVGVIGRTEGVRERYYAISPERRVSHAACARLVSESRRLFGRL